MPEFKTLEEATKAVDDLFEEIASQGFMTPALCTRFLVAPAPSGDVAFAIGGSGYYGKDGPDGQTRYFTVARLETAFALQPHVALALARTIEHTLMGMGHGQLTPAE